MSYRFLAPGPWGRRLAMTALLAVTQLATGGLSSASADAVSNDYDPMNHARGGEARLVLVYVPCTVSKAFLSPYTQGIDYTPNLERFARDGVVLNKHQVECDTSGVSYASIVSGCHAKRHGIFEHPTRMSDRVYLMTEAFAEAGYDVYYWGGHPQGDGTLNYAQGAGHIYDRPLSADDPEFEAILRKLSSDPGYKAFIFTNMAVTHDPYYPEDRNDVPDLEPGAPIGGFWEINSLPGEFESTGLTREELAAFTRYYHTDTGKNARMYCEFERYVGAPESPNLGLKKSTEALEYLYKLNIARLDHVFGTVVDKIDNQGLENDSIIVFSADHGEAMYRDNTLFRFTHGFELLPEVLSTPLLIRAPAAGVKPGRGDFVTRSIDIFPTVAGLAGVELPIRERPDGIDLSPVLRGKKGPPQLRAFSHTAILPSAYMDQINQCPPLMSFFGSRSPRSNWVSMRDGDNVFKWIRASVNDDGFSAAVYDLSSDPEERQNLYQPNRRRYDDEMQHVKEFKQGLEDAYVTSEKRRLVDIMDEEKRHRLRLLGYID